MNYNKHFISTNEQNYIIRGFSDAFEQPQDDDIPINEYGGRHFELHGLINPPLHDVNGIPLYRWDGKGARERTQEEIQTDLDAKLMPESSSTLSELIMQMLKTYAFSRKEKKQER